MKKLFLTSNAASVIQDVVKHFDKPVKGLRVPFILTAGEAEDGDKSWLYVDKDALTDIGFDMFDYTLTGKTESQVRADLKDIDVLFFSGGNTFFLLQEIQQSNTAGFFKELVDAGIPYIGSSAGSVVAGPDIKIVDAFDDMKKAPLLAGTTGLSLVDFIVLPHWGSVMFKDAYLNEGLKKAYDCKEKLVFLRDNQYVYVHEQGGETLYQIQSVT